MPKKEFDIEYTRQIFQWIIEALPDMRIESCKSEDEGWTISVGFQASRHNGYWIAIAKEKPGADRFYFNDRHIIWWDFLDTSGNQWKSTTNDPIEAVALSMSSAQVKAHFSPIRLAVWMEKLKALREKGLTQEEESVINSKPRKGEQ